MKERKRILTTATLAMVFLAVLVTATESFVLYRSAVEEKQLELHALARREAQVIGATFRNRSNKHGPADHASYASMMSCPKCSAKVVATLEVMSQIGNLRDGWGDGVEFVIGKRDGDAIQFLLPCKHAHDDGADRPRTVPWRSELAEPMRMALSGLSGTVEAKDYRGEVVVAGYAPVDLLGWGVVAKIDLTEMRAPFIASIRNSLALAALAILVGLVALRKTLNPLIQRSQDSEVRALRALAELRSQKYAMDEHSIVAITDRSGKITYVNDKFCAVSQYSREELIGQDHRLVNSGHHPRTFFAEMWKTIAAGKVWHGEVRNRAKDGSMYWLETTIVPFQDHAGRVTQYIAIRTEITDRKRADKVLWEAKVQAEVANQAKSEFLANMSHEIRTPMTAILGFAENLLYTTQSETEKVNCIHTIRRNGENLLLLINDILDLSKIEAGKMTVERRDCQPCHVIAEVASLMRVRAVAKGLHFNIEYIGVIPETIQSDPTRLRQILINLIANAIKFTETGNIRLVIRFVPGERKGLPGERPGDREDSLCATNGERKDVLCEGEDKENLCPSVLKFDVMDTGRGMTQKQVAKLFHPFTQADTSTTRKFGGTGLGLTISKRFAELLGGDITVAETDLGVGSTFRVTVSTGSLESVKMLDDPTSATVAADPTGTAAQAAPSDLHGVRILLAEDGPDNRRLISFVLKNVGADVTVAENGKLALEKALAAMNRRRHGDPEYPFDIILMDMQMPVMDGYEATTQLRRKGYTKPIIALTAHAMAGDREKCIKAGCDDYATKPINRTKLIEMIHRWHEHATGEKTSEERATSALSGVI